MFILGTGTSSMLYQKIREELGLCYGIDSWLGRYRGGGYIAVSVSLAPASEEKAINEIIKIVGSFPCSVTDKQVNIAKEKLISSLIMSREQPQSKFSSMGYNQLMLGRVIEDDDIINSIKEVTLERVIEVSKKYLKLDDMAFTAVGKVRDKKEYENIIKKAIGKQWFQ
jgi:predicted Zn-dependent peptidase